MTALEKQIAASEKRLAKFEKNVGMYRDRADKKLALLQESGFMVTREDFTVFKTGRWKYDYDYTVSDKAKQILTLAQYSPVVDNLLSERENAERAENEKKELAALKEKNTEKDRAEKEVAEQNRMLVNRLEKELLPFRQQWLEDMTKYHREFYHRIHEALPNARKQYKELEKEIYEEKRKNCFRPSARIKKMEETRRAFGRILSAPPAAHNTEASYMDYIKPRLEEEYNNCLYILADKCRPFELDLDKVQVHHPRMSSRGFDVMLTDDKDRVVDVRMIWAAENSELVTPHTRYIITERTVKEKKESEAENRISDIHIYSVDNCMLFIRCKIDGVQQMGRKLSLDDTIKYNDGTDKIKLAERYFKDALQPEREQGRGMKR